MNNSNRFRAYWRTRSPAQKIILAERAQTSNAYLQHIASGFRRASWEFAQVLSQATGGAVTKSDLRPDIWPKRKRKRAQNG